TVHGPGIVSDIAEENAQERQLAQPGQGRNGLLGAGRRPEVLAGWRVGAAAPAGAVHLRFRAWHVHRLECRLRSVPPQPLSFAARYAVRALERPAAGAEPGLSRSGSLPDAC